VQEVEVTELHLPQVMVEMEQLILVEELEVEVLLK
jgi:hypothetical protein